MAFLWFNKSNVNRVIHVSTMRIGENVSPIHIFWYKDNRGILLGEFWWGLQTLIVWGSESTIWTSLQIWLGVLSTHPCLQRAKLRQKKTNPISTWADLDLLRRFVELKRLVYPFTSGPTRSVTSKNVWQYKSLETPFLQENPPKSALHWRIAETLPRTCLFGSYSWNLNLWRISEKNIMCLFIFLAFLWGYRSRWAWSAP